MNNYDAVLLLSFGGPDSPKDVMPFLRNVVRGRNVPETRLQAIADRYLKFGGKSPINKENSALIRAMRSAIPELPIYWGNRNWHPLVSEALSEMSEAGVKRAIAFTTSAYSSYSGCRQYLEDIESARATLGNQAPIIDKIPPFFKHLKFIDAVRSRLQQVLSNKSTNHPHLLFTAHSLPLTMATLCNYETELRWSAKQIAEDIFDGSLEWQVVYQSRSGPPTQQWLTPDILDTLRQLHKNNVTEVVVVPIGFVCDHMEVIYDLDIEAKTLANDLGIELIRAPTVGTHPSFVQMIRELVLAPSHKFCERNCCL